MSYWSKRKQMKPVKNKLNNIVDFLVGDIVFTNNVNLPDKIGRRYKVLGFIPCLSSVCQCYNWEGKCRYGKQGFVIQDVETHEIDRLCMGIRELFWHVLA